MDFRNQKEGPRNNWNPWRFLVLSNGIGFFPMACLVKKQKPRCLPERTSDTDADDPDPMQT